jgi:peptide/nickel transport system substrate-binding protein
MKRLRWQLLIIFLTGLVVGILLLNEQQPKPAEISATPTPVRGGAYTEALVGTFQRFNPILDFYNQPDRDVARLIFSGLVRFDSRGVAQGDLAEGWGPSADGTLYNVYLRKDLKWHDGKPLTSDDVLFTIDLMRNGGKIVPADLQAFWKGVEAVRLSEQVIQFRLPEAFAPFPDYLSFGVLPKHLLDGKTIEDIANDPFNLQPVGSGPFKFNRLITENDRILGVALTAYDGYYLQKPYIQELVFRAYEDDSSALQAYRDGEVQGIGQVGKDILSDVLAEKNLAVYTARQSKLALVLFNLNNPDVAFLQEKVVRKALLTGLNRQRIIDRALQGQGVIANGPILEGSWGYYTAIKPVEYDLTSAKNLLKQAGYTLAKDGDTILSKKDVQLKFTLSFPDTPTHNAVAAAIQAAWADLGVDVTLEAVPYDQLVSERLADRSYQAALIDLDLSRTPDPDPYPFWDQAQATGAGQNYSQWDNRMASEYLEQARILVDNSQRARMYRNFQVVFQEEMPALPLYNPVSTYAVSRDVQDVSIGPLYDPADRFNSILTWHLLAIPHAPSLAPATPTTKP